MGIYKDETIYFDWDKVSLNRCVVGAANGGKRKALDRGDDSGKGFVMPVLGTTGAEQALFPFAFPSSLQTV